MQPGKITLDRIAFKALASETRINILKTLDLKPMTVSELSRKIAMNKATTYEHLGKLVDAGLVKRREDKNKWVYYKLTWKGKNILHPETVKIALTLCATLILIIVLFAAISYNKVDKEKDTTPPKISNWEIVSNDTNTNYLKANFVGEAEISVLVKDYGEYNSGIDNQATKLWYGIASNKNLIEPNIIDWISIETEVDENQITGRIKDVPWKDYEGKYLYLKCFAEDIEKNNATSIFKEYINPIDAPDLTVSENIKIDYDYKQYNKTGESEIIINATIFNRGTKNATEIKIGFYEENPDNNNDGIVDNNTGLIGYDIISVNASDSSNATIKWHTRYINSSNVSVFADPKNEVVELEETNNMQQKRLPYELFEHEYPSGDNETAQSRPPKEGDEAKSLTSGSICLLIIAFPIVIAIFIILSHWLSKKFK